MFSQFRHAVESLAPPRRSGSVDETVRTRTPEDTSTTPSPIAPSASSSSSLGPLPLGDSAAAISNITNLRKLPFGQRSSSPAPTSRTPTPQPGAQAADKDGQAAVPRRRPNLEDRLKARFAIGDVSPGDTPDASGRTTPLPPAAPLSPTSVPLPDSPPVSPLAGPLGDGQAPGEDVDVLDLSPPSESVEDATWEEGADPMEKPGVEEAGTENVDDRNISSSPPIASEKDDPTTLMDPSVRSTPSPEPESIKPTTPPEGNDSPPVLPEVTLAPPSPQVDDFDPLHVAPATPLHSATPPKGPPTPELPTQDTEPGASTTADAKVTSNITPQDSVESESPEEPSTEVAAVTASTMTDSEPTMDVPASEMISRPLSVSTSTDVEALQQRLKLIEQRFSDVSSSFKKLQAEKMAADKILQEFTSVSSLQDTTSLQDFLQNITLKTEMSQDEIKRLTGKLTRQEERLEELRDIHHMEAKSQNDLIDKLRKQVEDGQTASKASKDALAKAEGEAAKRKAELDRAHADAEKARTTAKEEEEKRTKAVSLLKTVRQKLVKTEKDRDDALKDAGAGRDKEREEREREKAERARLQEEIERVNVEKEKAIAGIKGHFDREIANLRDRKDKEVAILRGQYELEATTAKTNYSKELAAKDARVSTLEKSVQNLAQEKNRQFDQLQLRQAEFESSQSQLEALQSQTSELKYQLREAVDRTSLLADELAEARRAQDLHSHGASASAEESTRALALAEARFDARLADARAQLQVAERERNDVEADWARKLDEKVAELDTLRRAVERTNKGKEEDQETVVQVRAEADRLREEMRGYQDQIVTLRREADKINEVENTAKDDLAQLNTKVNAVQKALEESKGREAQLRNDKKTLREELRKVQSSAALLERQRNPGVGYFAGRTESSTDVSSPRPSTDVSSQNGSTSLELPPQAARNEEEVNLEYLRNVILQFLEHKDMRPNLVRVLSAVLRFTPQETRRLIAKV